MAQLQHHVQNEAVVARFEKSSSLSRTNLPHSKWWSSSASSCGKVVCNMSGRIQVNNVRRNARMGLSVTISEN